MTTTKRMNNTGESKSVGMLLDSEQKVKGFRNLDKNELLERYPWCKIHIWPFIETNYREPRPVFSACISSLFLIHNELLNIWTHLLGGIWMFYLFIVSISKLNTLSDKFIFGIYCLTAVGVCGASVSYHLFCCHSEKTCQKVQCLDWMVISTLIFSSNLIGSYYELSVSMPAFAVFTVFNVLFMCLTSWITFNSLQSMYINQTPTISQPKRHWLLESVLLMLSSYYFRAYIYIVYGFGVMIAWLMNLAITGIPSPTIKGILTMYGCYATVILCIMHFPEKYVPIGMVDIVVSKNLCIKNSPSFCEKYIFNIGIFAPDFPLRCYSGIYCPLVYLLFQSFRIAVWSKRTV